jgi:periplasmic protein TonB
MTEQLDEVEVKNRNISGVSTTVIVTIITLLLFLFQLELPERPKPIEEMGGGVAVSLGDPDAGGPNEVPIEASYTPPSSPAFQPEEIQETTKDYEAIPIPEKDKQVQQPKVTKPNNTTPTPQPPKKTQEQIEEESLAKKMADNAKKVGANGGTGSKPGAQGKPDGVPGGKPDGNGTGTDGKGPGKGSGDGDNGFGKATTGKPGVKHSFGNRKLEKFQTSNSDDCNADGTVIVDVIVKPDGSITPTGINPASKSPNQCLQALAKKIARNSKFAASDGTVSVEGTITINFVF